jgi:hypothetical protein
MTYLEKLPVDGIRFPPDNIGRLNEMFDRTVGYDGIKVIRPFPIDVPVVEQPGIQPLPAASVNLGG